MGSDITRERSVWGVRFPAVFLLLVVFVFPIPNSRSASKTPAKIQKLCELLTTGAHHKTRIQSAKGLAMLGNPAAAECLLNSMQKEPDQLVRSASAWALGVVNHPGAIPPLYKASKEDVEMVKEQAQMALERILPSFPGNLKGCDVRFKLELAKLNDRTTRSRTYATWYQHYFLELLLQDNTFDVGELMSFDNESDQEKKGFSPKLDVTLSGAVENFKTPSNREPGDVTVELTLTATLSPVKLPFLKERKFMGKAPFAGGPKPKDEWDADKDPLFISQKEAIQAAVKVAYTQLAQTLHVK